MENETIQKQAYVGATLKHQYFSHVVFEQCDFTQTDFTSSRFLECRFVNCNFSLTKVNGCRLQDVLFEKCKCVGVDFTKGDPLFLSLKFTQCSIDMCNFSQLDLKHTPFLACRIKETYFAECTLAHAHFGDSDLSGSLFHNTNLTHANFIGAIHYSINPLTNTLTKAKFSNPEVLHLLKYFEITIE